MKPSWVLSEDERQRRFRKNRERGPSEQTGQSSQGMERSEDYKVDQAPLPQTSPEQNLPVVKKENSNSLIEQTKVETIPMSSLSFRDGSFQPPLMVKSECGEPSYLALAPAPASTSSSSGPSYLALAPATSSEQQPAILLYSTVAPHQQPTYNVTISSTSSVKKQTNRYPTSSVIVQPVQRQPAVRKPEEEGGSADPRGRMASSVEVIATTVRSQVHSSQANSSGPLNYCGASAVGYKLEVDADWDSNYEDDIFTSDEELEEQGSMHALHNNQPEVKFSQDEFYQLSSLVKAHNDKYRSVNFGEELIKEMIMCSMFGIPVSTSAAINGYRLTVERITRIAHNLECFTDLNKTDQSHLLMENADLLVNLRGAIFFDSRKKGVNQILISMGIGRQTYSVDFGLWPMMFEFLS